MKITIIGPIYPYKGGIAHYTGLMAKHLSKENDVDVISYKKQYPKLLYNKEQKDYENDSLKYDNSNFLINTVNPFSCFKTAKHIKKTKPDLLIIQWWHPFFTPCYWLILKLLGKNKPKTLFLCHCVLPHEKIPFQKFLSKTVLKKGNVYIVQSETDEKHLKQFVKNPLYTRTVMPAFNLFKQQNLSKSDAYEQLGLNPNEKVILFFGFIREYKGLKHLIRAMPQITSSIPEIELIIVGEFFENNKDEYIELIKSTNCENSIILYDGYTPDKEVEKYFAACDVVVLPYESATQSGIVQIAYDFNKPVIATNVGGLPEVVTDGKTGFLIEPYDAKNIAEAIIKFYSSGVTQEFTENIKEESSKYSWAVMGDIISSLYNEVSCKKEKRI